MKLLAFALALGLASFGIAQQFPPRPVGTWISDQAHLLDASSKKQIGHDSSQMMGRFDAPIVIATIPSLAAEHAKALSIDSYTRKLFDRWGVGSEVHNHGILILVSKGDRNARIELGKKWGHGLDAESSQVMRLYMVPKFKSGNYAGGIVAGADHMLAVATQATRAGGLTPEGARLRAEVERSNTRPFTRVPIQYTPADSSFPPGPQFPNPLEAAPVFGAAIGVPFVFAGFVFVFLIVLLRALAKGSSSLGGPRRSGFRSNNSLFDANEITNANNLMNPLNPVSPMHHNGAPTFDPTPSPTFSDSSPSPTYSDPSPSMSTPDFSSSSSSGGFDSGSSGGGGATGSW